MTKPKIKYSIFTDEFNASTMTYEALEDYYRRIRIANDKIIADIRSSNSR